jgi:hypothetical protein
MKLLSILLWLAAYSGCLFHIVLFSVIYYRYKHKTELRFLSILINIFIITRLIMAMSQTMNREDVFNLILGNCLLSFYVTVPYFVYTMNAIARKYYALIPVVMLAAAFVYNVCIFTRHAAIAFSTTSVFFVILFIPVFPRSPKASAEKHDGEGLGKAESAMFAIALCFAVTAFLLHLFAATMPYVLSNCFALFSLAYQVPGLLYCKSRLLRRSTNMDLSPLTKRGKLFSNGRYDLSHICQDCKKSI